MIWNNLKYKMHLITGENAHVTTQPQFFWPSSGLHLQRKNRTCVHTLHTHRYYNSAILIVESKKMRRQGEDKINGGTHMAWNSKNAHKKGPNVNCILANHHVWNRRSQRHARKKMCVFFGVRIGSGKKMKARTGEIEGLTRNTSFFTIYPVCKP